MNLMIGPWCIRSINSDSKTSRHRWSLSRLLWPAAAPKMVLD